MHRAGPGERGGASYGRRAVAAAKGASKLHANLRGGEGVNAFGTAPLRAMLPCMQSRTISQNASNACGAPIHACKHLSRVARVARAALLGPGATGYHLQASPDPPGSASGTPGPGHQASNPAGDQQLGYAGAVEGIHDARTRWLLRHVL